MFAMRLKTSQGRINKLYEMQLLSSARATNRGGSGMGSSGSSLHSKTFAVDQSRIFIGSFNFDPRSAKLNTEMGFIIESPSMANKIEGAFSDSIPANAYEVRLSESGDLHWIERAGKILVRHDIEPGSTFWQRAGVCFMSILPIDSLL